MMEGKLILQMVSSGLQMKQKLIELQMVLITYITFPAARRAYLIVPDAPVFVNTTGDLFLFATPRE